MTIRAIATIRQVLPWIVAAALLLTSAVTLAQPLAAQDSAVYPGASEATATPAHQGGGEANLQLPDLGSVNFFGGTSGRTLLMGGLLVCALGLLFGLMIYTQLKNMPVHRTMREVSELIYETCKTYLITQGKFLMILWLFIGTIITFYFGFLQHFAAVKVGVILAFSAIDPPMSSSRRGMARCPTWRSRP